MDAVEETGAVKHGDDGGRVLGAGGWNGCGTVEERKKIHGSLHKRSVEDEATLMG